MINVALKEWAVVCEALKSGRQIVLLRKGGISESIGGFELEHRRFVLFPTYLHQRSDQVKEADRRGLESLDAEPARIPISLYAEVSDIVKVKDRKQIDAIDREHIWAGPLIDMRFNYRPQNPLYLLLVRVWRLASATTIDNTPAYAGCKSWVPLEVEIDTAGATPVLDDPAYEVRRAAILRALGQAD